MKVYNIQDSIREVTTKYKKITGFEANVLLVGDIHFLECDNFKENPKYSTGLEYFIYGMKIMQSDSLSPNEFKVFYDFEIVK